MDCNNYSYINYGSDSFIMAETEEGLNGLPVTFEICTNWFGDRFYFISDLAGSCAEYHITRYEDAARFYNSLVTEKDAIPLFE